MPHAVVFRAGLAQIRDAGASALVPGREGGPLRCPQTDWNSPGRGTYRPAGESPPAGDSPSRRAADFKACVQARNERARVEPGLYLASSAREPGGRGPWLTYRPRAGQPRSRSMPGSNSGQIGGDRRRPGRPRSRPHDQERFPARGSRCRRRPYPCCAEDGPWLGGVAAVFGEPLRTGSRRGFLCCAPSRNGSRMPPLPFTSIRPTSNRSHGCQTSEGRAAGRGITEPRLPPAAASTAPCGWFPRSS
ncbi:hypothetical protein ABIB27_001314 [Arthrobacter sp. UYEF21]